MDFVKLINNLLYKDKYHCISCRQTFDINDKCDEVIVDNLGICLNCLGKLPWIGSGTKFFSKFDNENEIYAPLFYSGLVRDIIIQYKFQGMRKYAAVLADIIQYRLDEPHIDVPSRFDMIVPVPLSKERLHERGYNQSALIAKKLAKIWNIEYSEDALVRIRNTKKQSMTKSIKERFENVHGAFRAVPEIVGGKRILIFDDIYTTGHTMIECADAVKLASAQKVGTVAIALATSGKYMLI